MNDLMVPIEVGHENLSFSVPFFYGTQERGLLFPKRAAALWEYEPRHQRTALFASSISALPGLSACSHTFNSSAKYLRLVSRLPLSCAARAAPYSARKRLGSFFSVASNCSSACAGWLTSSSISPKSSRAGASGPGVMAFLSVPSSISAADFIVAKAKSLRPSANELQATSSRRWISACPAQ